MTLDSQLDSPHEAWQEIDGSLDELAELSRSVVSTRAFCSELLESALQAVGGLGGAVYRRREGRLAPIASVPLDSQTTLAVQENERRLQWLGKACESGKAQASTSAALLGKGAVELTIVAGPINVDDQSVGVIELMLPAGASPASQRSYVNLLEALAELASDFFGNQQRRELSALQETWREMDVFARLVHSDPRPAPTAFTVANETRRILRCDRVGVLLRRRGRLRIRAISGIDVIESRAAEIRAVQKLARLAARVREPIWFGLDMQAPQLESTFQKYVDLTHVKVMGLIPLQREFVEGRRREPLSAMLVVECFSTPADVEVLQRQTDLVCQHASPALRNSQRFRHFHWRVLEWLGQMLSLRRLPLTMLFLVLLCGAIGGGIWAAINVPAAFEIKARGELTPLVRRRVFAPSQGVIESVHVRHGQAVQENSLLLQMSESDVDFEYTKLLGEQQTTQKELELAIAARLSASRDRDISRDELHSLTAREEQLKEELENLGEQLQIIRRKRDAFEVTSPIDGQVVTWNLDKDLPTMPVRRGQFLMSVADTQGEWIVELRVPDERMQHVLDARKQLKPDLDVEFMVGSQPGEVHHGVVRKIAMVTDADPDESPAVLVTVAFDRQQVEPLRMGATVVARIQCGERPLGYVWFHSIYERLRLQFFF